MNTFNERAENERALQVHTARQRAAEVACCAGAAESVLHDELRRIARLTPKQLLHGARRAA